jgi:hypothetical protein
MPTESYSSSEEEGEGELTPPPLSPSRTTPPPFGDITNQEVGITMSGRRPKRTQTRIGSPADMPQQPQLMPVTPNLKGSSVLPVLTELAHLYGIL